MWIFALFPSLLMQGYVQAMQKNWGNFYHAYVEFCFVTLATGARLCTNDAKNWGNFYHAYVEFCFLPLASKYFRDAKYPCGILLSSPRY